MIVWRYVCIVLLIGACGRVHFDVVGDGSPTDSGSDSPSPGLVQQITNAAETVSSLTATLPAPPASGNVLVLVGTSQKGVIRAISGGGVATWTRATISNTACNVEFWYGVSDGSNATVSIGDAANTGEMWLNVSEWSGLDASNPVDNASATGGSISPAGTGGITTAHSIDLLLLAVSDHVPNTFGAPSPGTWTAMTPIVLAACTQSEWYRVVYARGTYDPQVAETANGWDAAIVALRIPP